MLSTGLLMQGQVFADSHRHCEMREGGEDGQFGAKRASDEPFCPSTVHRCRSKKHPERCLRSVRRTQYASRLRSLE